MNSIIYISCTGDWMAVLINAGITPQSTYQCSDATGLVIEYHCIDTLADMIKRIVDDMYSAYNKKFPAQKTIALEIGTTQQHISRLMHGKTMMPGKSSMDKLVKFYLEIFKG